MSMMSVNSIAETRTTGNPEIIILKSAHRISVICNTLSKSFVYQLMHNRVTLKEY